PPNSGLAGLIDVVQTVKVQNDLAGIATFAEPAAPDSFQMQNVAAPIQLGSKIAAELRMNHVGERPTQCLQFSPDPSPFRQRVRTKVKSRRGKQLARSLGIQRVRTSGISSYAMTALHQPAQ